MGYTTDFIGEFELNTPLTPEHKAYLEAFADTRRMKRDDAVIAKLPDPIREAVGLPAIGAYYVAGVEDGNFGQKAHVGENGILEYNYPPEGQPGIWCQWTPNDAGDAMEWDYGEKFYSYVEWIVYLRDHFLAPWGYIMDGEVEWEGEDRTDAGKIIIVNNLITVYVAKTQREYTKVEEY